jgi:hypothetical protein
MTTHASYADLRAAHSAALDRKAKLYPSDPAHAELQREVDVHLAAIIGWHDEMGDRPACPRVAEIEEEQTSVVVDRVFARTLEVA